MRLHLDTVETMWLCFWAVAYFGIRVGQYIAVTQ